MIQYLNNVGKTIPQTLRFAQRAEVIKDTHGLVLYGYYEDTGFRGFFKKIRQGLKALKNG
ncbi:MAG: hypothetical protein CL490_07355 [Acinetobacter sp.]|nr:hypothetical protein [Acinetobacter sp.]|tara:strand:+ start:3322 stop:3501 length:180 start_codon:yes stop_codon:yes gene_type:complete